MDYEENAINLLNEWQRYKCLHYSAKTKFAEAVDIEIEKDAVCQLAKLLVESLTTADMPLQEIEFRINIFAKHLNILKDRITFELLKNGN